MTYRVEELAQMTGVSVDTIRFYQSKLLLPGPDREGRRAVYQTHHLERLIEIRRLADEGFSLAQIARLSSESNPLLETLAELDQDLLTADGVAERANVAPMVVDLVASTGLIRPIETPQGQRFDASAVEMLTAASAVVGAGVPINDLLVLAKNHAANIDEVVDAAVELFRSHIRAGTEHDDQLAGVVRSLMPQVTRLVAQHFERTLVERALAAVGDGADARVLEAIASSGASAMTEVGKWVTKQIAPLSADSETAVSSALARAAATNRPQFVTRREEIDPTVDVLSLVAAATTDAFVWIHPESRTDIAALGTVAVLDAPETPARFEHAAGELRWLRDDLHLAGVDGPAHAGPLVVGGFSFFDAAPTTPWEAFPSSRLVLAAASVVRRDGKAWLSVTVRVEVDDDASALCAQLRDLTESALVAMSTVVAPPMANAVLRTVAAGPYEELVAAAVRDVRRGVLDKVVVARSVRTDGRPDPIDMVRRLRADRPNCATMAQCIAGDWFVASTPELLVRLDHGIVQTSAVAATVARTGHDGADRLTLTSDQKQLVEHRYVVEAIRARLESCGVTLDPASPPGVLELPNLLHLHTPIRGSIHRRDTGVIDLVGVLHPTPAVSGTPRRVAEEWLLDNEELERGWYAAPVGFADLRGDGEFWVGLRSALITKDHAELFSGAGIVGQSDPVAEFNETETKLRAMARAMGTE